MFFLLLLPALSILLLLLLLLPTQRIAAAAAAAAAATVKYTTLQVLSQLLPFQFLGSPQRHGCTLAPFRHHFRNYPWRLFVHLRFPQTALQ